MDILTTDDVMAMMRWRARETVYRQVASGRLKPIPGVRPHRFTRAAVERFLEGEQRRKPRRGRVVLPSAPKVARHRESRYGLVGR